MTRFVPPETIVVFGVFSEDNLWASLVLGFDVDRRVSLITTADPSGLDTSGGPEAVAKELVGWANGKFSPCSLGLFMDLDDAKELLASRVKMATLREMAGKDRLIADLLLEPLAGVLARS